MRIGELAKKAGVTRDTIRFPRSKAGGADGTHRWYYMIVDVNQNSVEITDTSGSGSITSGIGTKTIDLGGAGHDDIDGIYYVGLFNGQGGIASAPLKVDNSGGARTLVG
mgnify:CR=1 FL=1